jgi:hypothetical protein
MISDNYPFFISASSLQLGAFFCQFSTGYQAMYQKKPVENWPHATSKLKT